jgi:hypothetical protein
MKKAFAVPMSVALIALAASPASAGDPPAEVEVLIRDNAPAFHGKVVSDEPECYQMRSVDLFRVKDGPNKLLGTDLTTNTGRWDILEDQFNLRSGVYYAKAFGLSLESGTECKGDKSEKVFVD